MASSTINKTLSGEDYQNLQRIVHPRIIGGINTLDNELPFMAYIQVCNQPETICSLCGGAVIHRNFIVTAGHCKEDHQHHFNIRLNYQGYRDRIYIEYSIEIDKFIRHPYYNHKTVDHDIGLIQIPGTHGIPEVRMAQLPLGRPYTNDVLTVAGWGVTDYTKNTFPEVLQRLDVPVIDDDLCYNWLKITKEITFCAGFEEGGKDACQGDSGGPLFFQPLAGSGAILYGIVSWGTDCAKARQPGVYTNVFYYKNWLQQQINEYEIRNSIIPVNPSGGLIPIIPNNIDSNTAQVIENNNNSPEEVDTTIGSASLTISSSMIIILFISVLKSLLFKI